MSANPPSAADIARLVAIERALRAGLVTPLAIAVL